MMQEMMMGVMDQVQVDRSLGNTSTRWFPTPTEGEGAHPFLNEFAISEISLPLLSSLDAKVLYAFFESHGIPLECLDLSRLPDDVLLSTAKKARLFCKPILAACLRTVIATYQVTDVVHGLHPSDTLLFVQALLPGLFRDTASAVIFLDNFVRYAHYYQFYCPDSLLRLFPHYLEQSWVVKVQMMYLAYIYHTEPVLELFFYILMTTFGGIFRGAVRYGDVEDQYILLAPLRNYSYCRMTVIDPPPPAVLAKPKPAVKPANSCGPEFKKLISSLMYKKCQGKAKTLKHAKTADDKRRQDDALRMSVGKPSRCMENREAREAAAGSESTRRTRQAEASKKFRSKWAAQPTCKLEQLGGRTMEEALVASKVIWDAGVEGGTGGPAEFYLQYAGYNGRYREADCIRETTTHLQRKKGREGSAVLRKQDGTSWSASGARDDLQPELAVLYETNSTLNARNFEGALHELQQRIRPEDGEDKGFFDEDKEKSKGHRELETQGKEFIMYKGDYRAGRRDTMAAIKNRVQNEARKLEEPYLRAQCFAHLAAYDQPNPNNQPTIQAYTYDIELSDTTPDMGY
ncbi:hypothetical protein B484DRAFT_402659 [Ochromonadaceae sp. CCMP2298]|nr:hypothetical protein B484DRAFT_402659 [Ochromonadaceae sp. CCMP2298]